MGKRKQGDWQKIHQDLQAIYEREEETASRRQQLLILVVVVLVSISVLGLIRQSQAPMPPSQTLETETPPSDLEQEPKQPSDEELALVQTYQADKNTYQFNWDVASVEQLRDSWSATLSGRQEEPSTLDDVIAAHGKPSLVHVYDGILHFIYSDRFVADYGELAIGRYRPQVSLSFQNREGTWVLFDKGMLYMVSEPVRTLVEQAPQVTRFKEGTNQKRSLNELAAPLVVGQPDTGQGGTDLVQALQVMGKPYAYGFWTDSRTLHLVYEDMDRVDLWFKRQENGDYLLAEQD